MELRDFISAALLEIIEAVKDTQSKTPAGSIVPKVNFDLKSVNTGLSEFQSVEFEVTVRADNRAGSKGRLSVVAAVIGAKVEGESAQSDGHSASLKFRIPVRLPSSNSPEPAKAH